MAGSSAENRQSQGNQAGGNPYVLRCIEFIFLFFNRCFFFSVRYTFRFILFIFHGRFSLTFPQESKAKTSCHVFVTSARRALVFSSWFGVVKIVFSLASPYAPTPIFNTRVVLARTFFWQRLVLPECQRRFWSDLRGLRGEILDSLVVQVVSKHPVSYRNQMSLKVS